MQNIYYRVHNAHPKAVIAAQRDDGSWTIENEAKVLSVALNEEGFRYEYRAELRDGDKWITSHDGFGGAEGICQAIADGAEPRWLTAKEEIEQHASEHPAAWFLDLNILAALKREDLPWGTVRDVKEGFSLEWNKDDDWALPLVVLISADCS